MAIIVSLETSTGVCSAALHDDGKLIASKYTDVPQSASSELAVMVRDLLEENAVKPGMISAVAVAAGPGSYTGLRIGVATAKGLCYALGIPLLSVNTLELITHQVLSTSGFTPQENEWWCPMLDARRMEVYCLLADKALNIVQPTVAMVIDENSFTEWMAQGRVFFFGNGAEKCRGVIHHPNAFFIQDVVPLAAAMGRLVFGKFEEGNFESLSGFEPFYLKDFVAKKPKARL